MGMKVYSYAKKFVLNIKKVFTPGDETTTVDTDYLLGGISFAPWGEDNLFPQQLDIAASKSGVLQSALQKLVEYAYGQGTYLYKDIVDETTGEVSGQKIIKDKKVEAWWRSSNIPDYYIKAYTNLFRYGTFFPEFLLSVMDSNKVAKLGVIASPWCRLSRMDPVTMKIDWLFVTARWPILSFGVNKDTPDTSYFQKVQFIDLEDCNWMDKMQKGTIKKWASRCGSYTAGNIYYFDQPWHATYKNGWVAIASKVPQMKEGMFNNMMSPKFMLYYDEDYFRTRYKSKWDDWTDEEREKVLTDWDEDMSNNLHDTENTGKTIRAPIRYDQNGNQRKSIIIECIDNKFKDSDGTFITETQQANNEILFTLIDACLIGAGIPGGKLGAGSGSDKREAMFLLNNCLKLHRDVVDAPIYNCFQMNGFDPDIKIGHKFIELATLDKNPTGYAQKGQQ